MKSMYVKVAIFVLIIGLLAACGSQATDAPGSVSQSTQAVPPVVLSPIGTEAATNPSASTNNAGTATEAQAGQGTTISFTHDVLPILENSCTNCHGGQRTDKGLNLTTYAALMQGSQNGSVVAAGDAADSKLVELIVNQRMPKRGPKLTPPQVEVITNWVNQGALNN